MSQIKTTSKVSLKLTGRINLGRRGVCAPSSRLWTQPTSPSPLPRAWKGPSQAIAPTRTTNNSSRTGKSATNWNHRLFLKSTVSKIDPGHNPQAPTSPLSQTGKGQLLPRESKDAGMMSMCRIVLKNHFESILIEFLCHF